MCGCVREGVCNCMWICVCVCLYAHTQAPAFMHVGLRANSTMNGQKQALAQKTRKATAAHVAITYICRGECFFLEHVLCWHCGLQFLQQLKQKYISALQIWWFDILPSHEMVSYTHGNSNTLTAYGRKEHRSWTHQKPLLLTSSFSVVLFSSVFITSNHSPFPTLTAVDDGACTTVIFWRVVFCRVLFSSVFFTSNH